MDLLKELDAVQVTRGFFIFGTATGLVVNAVPFLKKRYLDYGARSSANGSSNKDPTTGKPVTAADSNFVDKALALKVPHAYFLHYYITSLACSLFWGVQILTQGRVLRTIAPTSRDKDVSTMHIDQVVFIWALMVAQAYRRLHETSLYMKPSASTMSLFIYFIGLAYYFMLSIAVWAEGSAAILDRENIIDSLGILKIPSMKTMIFFPIFICASGIQNDCHRYLGSLEKYTLPVHPIFQRLICPHYLMECIIYLSMAIMAAPQGKWVNGALMANFVFVVVNLGLVADTAKKWSIEKFGKDKVASRWRMIPWIW